MKVKIYSVIEKKPPIDEELIKWNIEDNNILEFKFVEAYIAIPEDEEELALIPKQNVPDMIWNDGSDMLWDDKWSYSSVSKGE